MGVFFDMAFFPRTDASGAKNVVADVAENPTYQLQPSNCEYQEQERGSVVYFNEGCCGYEPLAKALSEHSQAPVLYLYIYDSDLWGYYFYEDGSFLDAFSTVPDANEEEDPTRLRGNPGLIARYFEVDEEQIRPYLIPWTEEIIDTPAFPDDQSCYGDDWQLVDFFEKLGLQFRENDASVTPQSETVSGPGSPLCVPEPKPGFNYNAMPDDYGALPDALQIDMSLVERVKISRDGEETCFFKGELTSAQAVKLLEDAIDNPSYRIEIQFLLQGMGTFVKKLKKTVYRPFHSTLVLCHKGERLACCFFAGNSLKCHRFIYNLNGYRGIDGLSMYSPLSKEDERLLRPRIIRGLLFLFQDLNTADRRLYRSDFWSPEMCTFGGNVLYDKIRREWGITDL